MAYPIITHTTMITFMMMNITAMSIILESMPLYASISSDTKAALLILFVG